MPVLPSIIGAWRRSLIIWTPVGDEERKKEKERKKKKIYNITTKLRMGILLSKPETNPYIGVSISVMHDSVACGEGKVGLPQPVHDNVDRLSCRKIDHIKSGVCYSV